MSPVCGVKDHAGCTVRVGHVHGFVPDHERGHDHGRDHVHGVSSFFSSLLGRGIERDDA